MPVARSRNTGNPNPRYPRRVREVAAQYGYQSDAPDAVLVAVLRRQEDLEFARDRHWYRIPVATAPGRGLGSRTIAFYQTGYFGGTRYCIRHHAAVLRRTVVTRRELLPEQWMHERANHLYHKLELEPLQTLERPILSKRGAFIVFLPTTFARFNTAQQTQDVNDLWNESPLEDLLWDALKANGIEAERQHAVEIDAQNHRLDFAIFCNGANNVAVECDGDTYHSTPEQIPLDNERSNRLESAGWAVLRFNGNQLANEMDTCLRKIRETMNQHGGLKPFDGEVRYFADEQGDTRQLSLFG